MYIGPGALMPLASAVAAIAGVALMLARRVVCFVRLAAPGVSSRITFSS